MHWTQSANLLIMVLVGGVGLRWGGVAGAVVMLTLEEVLRMWTEYWHLPLGLLLLCVVFGAPRGLIDRKSTRLNSSHQIISYAVFCLKKKKQKRAEHLPMRAVSD